MKRCGYRSYRYWRVCIDVRQCDATELVRLELVMRLKLAEGDVWTGLVRESRKVGLQWHYWSEEGRVKCARRRTVDASKLLGMLQLSEVGGV